MGTIVTRNGQITIDKHIRDELGIEVGMPLNINKLGEMIIITKKDKSFWRKRNSVLPEKFNFRSLRTDSSKRYRDMFSK
jgi:AbrB family looped-hinge helix DNA binding protein|tara:strand:+ start:309 stop:545 length:237 start_codon:yes stop_codon:yes gene_type:complete